MPFLCKSVLLETAIDLGNSGGTAFGELQLLEEIAY